MGVKEKHGRRALKFIAIGELVANASCARIVNIGRRKMLSIIKSCGLRMAHRMRRNILLWPGWPSEIGGMNGNQCSKSANDGRAGVK